MPFRSLDNFSRYNNSPMKVYYDRRTSRCIQPSLNDGLKSRFLLLYKYLFAKYIMIGIYAPLSRWVNQQSIRIVYYLLLCPTFVSNVCKNTIIILYFIVSISICWSVWLSIFSWINKLWLIFYREIVQTKLWFFPGIE